MGTGLMTEKEKRQRVEEIHLEMKNISLRICQKFNIELKHDTMTEAALGIRKLVKEGKISKQIEDIVWSANGNQELIENDSYISEIFLVTEENMKILTEELKGVLF